MNACFWRVENVYSWQIIQHIFASLTLYYSDEIKESAQIAEAYSHPLSQLKTDTK